MNRMYEFLHRSLSGFGFLLYPSLSVPFYRFVFNRFRFDSRSWSCNRASSGISIGRTGSSELSQCPCFIGESSAPKIEAETCFQFFGHHTNKMLALSFWTTVVGGLRTTRNQKNTWQKIYCCLAANRTRSA